MPFPPSASCRNLDLPPVNLRFLQSHLTKNAFAIAPTHLCGIALDIRYHRFPRILPSTNAFPFLQRKCLKKFRGKGRAREGNNTLYKAGFPLSQLQQLLMRERRITCFTKRVSPSRTSHKVPLLLKSLWKSWQNCGKREGQRENPPQNSRNRGKNVEKVDNFCGKGGKLWSLRISRRH